LPRRNLKASAAGSDLASPRDREIPIDDEERSDPPLGAIGGNPEHESDPVEAALAQALTRASMAGQWTTVEVLSRELTARREARAAVVDLGAARTKRGRKP
jgi:hypothetical protein